MILWETLQNRIKGHSTGGLVVTKCKARAYLANAHATSTTGWELVHLNAETYDLNGNFDSTTNHDYTVPVTGYYQVNGSADRVNSIVGIAVNGSIVIEGVPGQTSNSRSNVSDILYLTAGQTVTLKVYGSTNTVVAASYATFLSIHLLSVDA